jgi:hypothetical protein
MKPALIILMVFVAALMWQLGKTAGAIDCAARLYRPSAELAPKPSPRPWHHAPRHARDI